MRLLIVDAVAHSRESLATFLNLQEWLEVVGEAAGVIDAMDLAQRHQPDVIIMDVNLPAADRFTIASKLSALDDPPAVILLTIHLQEQDLRQAQEAGAVACVEKSAGVDEILGTLRGLSGSKIEVRDSLGSSVDHG